MIIMGGEINHEIFSRQKKIKPGPALIIFPGVFFPSKLRRFTLLSLPCRDNFVQDEDECFVVVAFVGL
jgi:hypothetical protein